MKPKILLLTLRSAALFIVIGAIVMLARDYVLREWRVSQSVYLAIGFLLIWIALAASMRPLLVELRGNRKIQPMPVAPDQETNLVETMETVHRYPRHLAALVIAFGLLCVAAPYVGREPGKAYPIALYFGFGVVACIALVCAACLLRYSVKITRDRLYVTLIRTQTFRMAEILKTEIVHTKNGPQLIIFFRSGKLLRFGRILTGFSTMTARLRGRGPGGTETDHVEG